MKQILDIKYIINSINYFINYKNIKEKREKEKEEEYFEYYYKTLDDNSYIEKYSLDNNKILDNYKNKIDKKEFNKILILADKNKFPLVCIKILQILKENIKCLDLYLNKNNHIKNKEDIIFEFINSFMNDCRDDQKKIYKKELLERVKELAEISIDKLLNMNLKWMNTEHLLVLDKLNEQRDLKLKYIEEFINFYEENNLNEVKGKININEKDYKKILNIYIETLCKLKKEKNILNLLKEKSEYINDDCLKICLANNVFDAAIYIYIKQEQYLNALDLCKEYLII